MFRVRPLYPPQAAYRGIQGSVETCFTVRADGSVGDARVVGASSSQARRLLGPAALRTIGKWKFVPRRAGGHAVATSGVCQDLVFRLRN